MASYDPSKDPYYDPTAQYGSETNPYAKTNVPQYQTNPYQQQIMDWLNNNMGGPEGWQNTVGQVQDTANNVQPFMSKLPWGQGQIGQWLTNQMSGKGAADRAAKYRGLGMGQVNRAYTAAGNKLAQTSAEQGGMGSSEAAMMKARGLEGLVGARAGVEGASMEYEDALKNNMFQKGMAGLGAYEGIARGDRADEMNSANMLLNSLQPGMNVWGQNNATQQNLLNYTGQENQNQNAWNNNIWSQMFNKQGGGGVAGFLGSILPAAAGVYANSVVPGSGALFQKAGGGGYLGSGQYGYK